MFMEHPKIYAHRGGAGLWPELTLHAYKNAVALGVDCVDLDVFLTQDKKVVVTHDPFISNTLAQKDGKFLKENGPLISELTLAELKTYDVGRLNPQSDYSKLYPDQKSTVGETVPTLEEVLVMCEQQSHHTMHYQIEIKNDPNNPEKGPLPQDIVPAVVSVLKKHNVASRTVIHAFWWENVLMAKALLPEIKTAFLTESQDVLHTQRNLLNSWHGDFEFDSLMEVPDILTELKIDVWNPEGNTLDLSVLKRAHDRDLEVIPWTVDDTARMETLIRAGIDGIITNRPDRMRGILQNFGYPLPSPWSILA